MRRVILLAAVLLAVPAIAGCIGSDGGPTSAERVDDAEPGVDELPDPVTVLTDAVGDATRRNSDWAYGMTPCAEVEDAPDDAPGSCAVTSPVLDQEDPDGGVPAHPARDVVEVRFQETPETLEVELDVAELGEDLDGAIQEAEGGGRYDGTWYGVSWVDPTSGCVHEVFLLLSPSMDVVDRHKAVVVDCAAAWEDGAVDGPCQASTCAWDVAFEVAPGAPATLRWSVPRTLLASGGEGGTIPEARASSWHVLSDEGASSHSFGVDGPLVAADRFGPEYGAHYLDRTEHGENFTFTTPRVDASLPTGPVTVGNDDERVRDPPERPDLRIVNLTMEPAPDTFRFTTVLEEVAERPKNLTQSVIFGASGHFVQIGYVARGGDRQAFGNLYRGAEDPVSVPVRLTVRPGTPGEVTLEIARSEIPVPSEGGLLQGLVAQTGYYESEEHGVGGTGIDHGRWHDGDMTKLAGPHRIPPAPEGPTQDRATRVGDAPEDVEPPTDFTGTEARYDLLGAEVVSPAPDAMRFSLTVDDLSDLSPPSGYDAVFYAVGVEHPDGRTMLGHYRSRDRPGGEFLCAPDTTVMTDAPADPTQTAWTEVEGTILTSSSSSDQGIQGTGTGASGAIVVTAPPSCFGLEAGADELNVTTLEAGSYLVQRQANELDQTDVHELDHLESEGGFATAFADPPPQPAPSFWAQPFGIANFWDILGAILAIITVAATAALWLRRRRTFKSYLAEVRRIQKEHRSDPEARALALVELRRDLYEDLERHRISDSHYPIVLDRIRGRLTSARLTSIGRAFYDLPTHIALRIEAMLDDGHLAEEECEVLDPIVEESGMDEEAQDLLQDRLRRWVAQDREHLDVEASGG